MPSLTKSLTSDACSWSACARAAGQGYDRLLVWMEAVRAAVDYRSGATNAATTAAEALRAGTGGCQDHAHLFIAGACATGIPARCVGGYLWAGGDGVCEASHAWAEAHLPNSAGSASILPIAACRARLMYARASVSMTGRRRRSGACAAAAARSRSRSMSRFARRVSNNKRSWFEG